MKWVLIIGGALLALVGAVWTLQGVGVLPGSAMTGELLWAIVGPIVAIVGIALLWVGFARRAR